MPQGRIMAPLNKILELAFNYSWRSLIAFTLELFLMIMCFHSNYK